MSSSLLPEVTIYSDGGANPNPGPGGYGVILECRGVKKELSQGYIKTTNNRMELTGVITGLRALKTRSKVTIITDSQYTINGIEKGWAQSWKKNNWKKSDKKPALNADLWEILLELLEKHEVQFFWIKGHAGHTENERCDELATLAMQKKNLLPDEGFLQEEARQEKALLPSSSSPHTHLLPKGEGTSTGINCKKCGHELEKKIPKHTKKTLEKAYYYEYYHFCPGCSTNFMPEEGKRDIKGLRV